MGQLLFSSWQGEIIDNRRGGEAILPANLRVPAEFRPGERIKAFMGWEGIICLDEDVNIVDMCAAYVEAIQSESCGKCFPCRVGTRIVGDYLGKIVSGEGKAEHLDQIRALAVTIASSSKCSIGQTGLTPVLHALTYFPESFAASIRQGEKTERGRYRYAVTAPCSIACPSALDIPRYVEEIREQKFTPSLATIRRSICMPGTLGRVCVRPCESNCRRANIDEAISIKYLKRFVADYEIETKGFPVVARADREGGNVAIIGAGPAGLSCAYFLALLGHRVTVFEQLPEPGGMAAVGIPDYRLPRKILGLETETIREAGVEIRYGCSVGRDIQFDDLRTDYDALFIAVGAHRSSPMGVDGEKDNYRGFIPGIQYLLDINQGRDPYPEGKKVVVVGGGNVAIDCVRSSFRIGKEDVNLVYRRSKAEMPADPVEIHDAEEENVTFHYLCNPTKILARDGRVVGVECIRMELGEPDSSGRRRPVPIPGSEFIIDTDILIPAIGQQVDLSFLKDGGEIRQTRWNTVDVDGETFSTSQKGIFAAGDCVTGPDVLVRATGTGKAAAERIDQFLRGGAVEPSVTERFQALFSAIGVYDRSEQIGIVGGTERAHLTMMDPEERKRTFDEVEQGFRYNEAVGEAARCLRCYRVGMVALAGNVQEFEGSGNLWES